MRDRILLAAAVAGLVMAFYAMESRRVEPADLLLAEVLKYHARTGRFPPESFSRDFPKVSYDVAPDGTFHYQAQRYQRVPRS